MDWQRLLGEIMEYPGYTQTHIAKELGVSSTTIMRISKGLIKEPNYLLGAKLVSLYLRLKHMPRF